MNRRRTLATSLLALACLLGAGGRAEAQALEDYDYENLTFRGVGFDVGYLWPNKVEPTPVYNFRVDLGFLGPGVRIIPGVSYWTSRMKTSELARLAEQMSRLEALQAQGALVTAEDLGTIDWSQLSLHVDGLFAWDTDFKVQTFLGLGLGLHAMNGKGSAIEGTFVEDLLDSVAAGASAIAGLEVEPIRNFRLTAEARYWLLSDVRYPGVRFGGAIVIPQGGAR